MSEGAFTITEVNFRSARKLGFDSQHDQPKLYRDEAPFLMWLVTPVSKRCAELQTIVEAVFGWSRSGDHNQFILDEGRFHLPITPENVGYWLDVLGVSWDNTRPIETWDFTTPRQGLIVIWSHGKKKSERQSPESVLMFKDIECAACSTGKPHNIGEHEQAIARAYDKYLRSKA